MDLNKMTADMRPFDYLCRICASDTKGKKSVAECVFVLKTAALKEKIQKYLDLTVSEGDVLPKVICKSCYRSVEGIVSLSKIAVHTQMVLSNFLKPHAALIEPDGEFTSFGLDSDSGLLEQPAAVQQQQQLSKPRSSEEVVVNVSVSDPLTRETQQKMIGASRQRQTPIDTRFIPKSIAHRHISFSPNVPKEKVSSEATNLSVSKKSSPASVINYYSPSNQPQQQQQQQHQQQQKQQHSHQNQQQQVTVTSGGYVIGNVDAPTKAAVTAQKTPTLQAPPVIPATIKQPTPPPQPTGILSTVSNNKNRNIAETEQKRNNLKMTLKNIRAANAMNTGQVSLLKVSQKHQQQHQHQQQQQRQQQPPQSSQQQPPQQNVQQANVTKNSETPTTAKVYPKVSTPSSDVPTEGQQRSRAISPALARKSRKPPPQRRPTIAEIPSSLEALPKEIIIASVKKSKARHSNTERQQRSTNAHAPTDELEADAQKSFFPDDIPLGRVIKDFDLLKLIMKALKWPVTNDNMEAQITRLRNSKFTTIISDPNLLQDTDLTQLLGPYLAPVLFAAQAIQQQNQTQSQPKQEKTPTKAPTEDVPTNLSSVAANNLASAIPYRLPPETSVQLIPASPEEERPAKSPPQHSPQKSSFSKKKSRRQNDSTTKARDHSIIISDGDEEPSTSNANGRKQKTDEMLKPQVTFEPTTQRESLDHNTTENSHSHKSPLGLFERSKSISSYQRKYSNASENRSNNNDKAKSTSYLHFVDDIVLMEPESSKQQPKPSSKETSRKSANWVQANVTTDQTKNPFSSVAATPPITRPIIKRRKTVIHASPSKSKLPEQKQTVNQTSEIPSKQIREVETVLSKLSPLHSDVKTEKLKPILKLPSTEITITTSSPSSGPCLTVLSKPLISPLSSLALKSVNSKSTTNAKATASTSSATATSTATATVTTSASSALSSTIAFTSTKVLASEMPTPSKTLPKSPAITPTNSSTSKDVSATSMKSSTTPLTLQSLKQQQPKTPASVSAAASALAAASMNNKVSVSTSMSFFDVLATTPPSEKEPVPPKKPSNSKAALAEQLLEAVGLKKTKSNSSSAKLAEKESFTSSRESIHQIRSALKRSLKQAVEQNLRKQEEQPVVKQIADSTTKIVIRDNSSVEKKLNQPDSNEAFKSLDDIQVKIEVDKNSEEQQNSEKPKANNNSGALPSEDKDDHNLDGLELKQSRGAGRPRKTIAPSSVIKKSIAVGFKDVNDSSNTSTNPRIDEKTSSSSLNEVSNTVNTVSSTSETQARVGDSIIRKRGRKRKIDEEIAGKPAEVSDVELKKDVKEEFHDTESFCIGDGESKDIGGHIDDIDKKSDAGSSSSRPSRASKTLSKYYKGPDKYTSTRSTRSTRNK